MKVHFDDARVRCDAQNIESWVHGRIVAFDADGNAVRSGRALHDPEQREVIFQRIERRHENVHCPAAGFDADRRAYHSIRACVGQRVQGQSIALGRRARDQIEAVMVEAPPTAGPALFSRFPRSQRQRKTRRMDDALAQEPSQARTFARVTQVVLQRVDVDRKPVRRVDDRPGILEGRNDEIGRQTRLSGDRFHQRARLLEPQSVVALAIGSERVVAPEGSAVLAPENAERPARQ